ncbi:MAG TPA: hypothetical protein VEG40_02525 [Gaiellaceae bacterium]|nr:hypothetical protein [Gaiellaceae bacterium]
MSEHASPATYLAECFWPDLHETSVDEAAARIRESAAELTRAGTGVTLTGTILVPGDEVVFYLFDGDSADVVREACERARVPFERVVESVNR